MIIAEVGVVIGVASLGIYFIKSSLDNKFGIEKPINKNIFNQN
ncbi:MAG: hypothetical protein WCK67_07665 [bacterium]